MSPHRILVVARKEFTDILRDRRTLIFMLLLPILVMPVIMLAATTFAKSQLKAKESRELSVAISPLGQNQLRALAQHWFNEQRFQLLGLGLRVGLGQLMSLDDLAQLANRVDTLKASGGGGQAGDAALVAFARAFSEFNDEERQLLADAGAVANVMQRTRWIDIATVQTAGQLPPGVTLPTGLPGELADERVARAITHEEKSVHAAVHVPVELFEQLEEANVSVPITVLYDSSQSLSEEAYSRLSAFVVAVDRGELRLRLNAQQISPGFVDPLQLKSANLASPSRKLQAVLGGLLPYMIILFCFFGAFYPSLDLTAGEKERFTLETLLLAPISRLDIAAGKFVVVFVAAIIAAVLTTTSMALTFRYGVLPSGATEAFQLEFQPLALLLAASLLIPVAALFAALLLGVALCARSFKEAQSYTAPLQLLIILPAATAMMPDLETELHWAWVPLMNVSLLMKELLKGNYLWDFYAITLGSMLVLAAGVLWGASTLFRRESVLLRS